MTNTAITPFTANIPQADLDDLRDRVLRTRYAQDLPGVGWNYGVPTEKVRALAEYWANGFDWRAWEAKLNQYPQFTTEINGQNIYFLHIKSPVASATPLLLSHGWPGSVFEFMHVIEPLTNPVAHGGTEADAFHLVIPALPGFGFSGPTTEQGWTNNRVSAALVELMARLGYERYGLQGGDFGAIVAPGMGQQAPNNVIGVHVNAATYGFIPWGPVDEEQLATFTDLEKERLARLQNWMANGNGYFQIQATKPQTIALALADSPVGQLAWMYEKFKDWAYDPEHGDESVIPRDTILAHASLYWLTNTSASSARFYYEDMQAMMAWSAESSGGEEEQDWSQAADTPQVPLGVAAFAEDVALRSFGEQMYNIVHWSDFERGGHFAALEAPDLLVQDVRQFFAGLRDGTLA